MQNCWEMGEILNNLEYCDQVIFPTDKTNILRRVNTKKFKTMVDKVLDHSEKYINRDKVKVFFEKAREFLHEVGLQLSKIKVEQINKLLKMIPISTPKLLLKYHKKLNINDKFPTRLLILEINFKAKISKVGYLVLKAFLENDLVD